MKRKKMSADFENLQRRIARRLKAGMPLAGMLAATTLLCGCNESGFGRTAGDVPMDNPPGETEPSRPQQSAQPAKNEKNEDPETIPMGDVPCEPNRPQELENTRTTGAPRPAPNKKREKTDRGAVRGRFPSMDEEK